MWSRTDAEKVRSSFKRINKIKLSNTASQLFESDRREYNRRVREVVENSWLDDEPSANGDAKTTDEA